MNGVSRNETCMNENGNTPKINFDSFKVSASCDDLIYFTFRKFIGNNKLYVSLGYEGCKTENDKYGRL